MTQEHQAYPPDLLSFPLKNTTQISPATSGNSSGHERPKSSQTTESPIKSPSYSTTHNGLLDRFQTPTTSQGTIPLTNSKGGYVTLPRRPKEPNWITQDIRYSQALSNVNGINPYYDNFGAKIFGNTRVYHSLNKSEMDLGPINGKVVNPFHIPYSNIQNSSDEIEPAPSPAPGTPHAVIPRSSLSSPNIHNQLLALQAMSINTTVPNYSKFSSKLNFTDPRSLKVILRSENESLLKNLYSDVLNNGSNMNVISGTSGRTQSAPKPPPKPRKRNCNDPFLVNSGETVTQV